MPLKMSHPQPRVPAADIKIRLEVARLYVDLTRALQEVAYPEVPRRSEPDLEMLMVTLCVFIGDAEGRPMSATKIASYSGLNRASVYRRLDSLKEMNKIERDGRVYRYVENAMEVDRNQLLSKIVDKFCAK